MKKEKWWQTGLYFLLGLIGMAILTVLGIVADTIIERLL
jgi:hypothetical protein